LGSRIFTGEPKLLYAVDSLIVLIILKSGEEMFRILGVMVRLELISNLLRVESFLEIQAVRVIWLLFIRLVLLISRVPFFSLSGNAKGDGK
jgi:hypothetical protein